MKTNLERLREECYTYYKDRDYTVYDDKKLDNIKETCQAILKDGKKLMYTQEELTKFGEYVEDHRRWFNIGIQEFMDRILKGSDSPSFETSRLSGKALGSDSPQRNSTMCRQDKVRACTNLHAVDIDVDWKLLDSSKENSK